jgi:hypothetical protein
VFFFFFFFFVLDWIRLAWLVLAWLGVMFVFGDGVRQKEVEESRRKNNKA